MENKLRHDVMALGQHCYSSDIRNQHLASTCGQPDGGLEVSVVIPGQISDYTFAWYKGADLINGVTSANINGLTMGDYSVVATNKNTGCVSEAASTVGRGAMATGLYIVQLSQGTKMYYRKLAVN